jgi:uncharacterized protein YdeI (YjbR/CyaY-like superfamily)
MDSFRAKDRGAWRLWLRDNHASEHEVWLLFYKKRVGRPSISYDDAVEEALCYGWIDSIVRRVDDDSYAQKFTPRRRGSKWSASNLARMQKLIEGKRVSRAGMVVYLKRSLDRPAAENLKEMLVDVLADLEASLRRSASAWKNFQDLPPPSKKRYVLWVISAKRPDTRERRIKEAVELMARNARLLLK